MKNKVVLITGGTSGIGKAMAEVFGKQGSKIAVTGRRQDALDETVASLKAMGIDAMGVQGDVSKMADNERMAKAVADRFGGIDVLINNAGISMRAIFEDLNVEVIEQVMAINFYGTVYATKACMPYLLKSKGSVIGISSIAGFRGLPGRTGYSASKFAMNGFLEALRTEVLYQGVHVLIACPGFTASNIRNTALSKDGSAQGESPRNETKMMSAEECAEHIYKATVKRKKVLVLTTQGKLTVFLNKFLSGFMDKLVFNTFDKEADSPLKKG
jgi:short-subunit dehydrogenase